MEEKTTIAVPRVLLRYLESLRIGKDRSYSDVILRLIKRRTWDVVNGVIISQGIANESIPFEIGRRWLKDDWISKTSTEGVQETKVNGTNPKQDESDEGGYEEVEQSEVQGEVRKSSETMGTAPLGNDKG